MKLIYMRQLVILMVAFLSIQSCEGQNKNGNKKENKTNSNSMRTFDIKKFEENKGKGKIYNDPHIFDYITQDNYHIVQSRYEQDNYYSEEVSKKFDPYKYRYTYFLSGYLETEIKEFNNSILLEKEYDKKGKLIKDTNYDKNFKHTFEQIHDIILKEKK